MESAKKQAATVNYSNPELLGRDDGQGLSTLGDFQGIWNRRKVNAEHNTIQN